jgi:hypothetical protein
MTKANGTVRTALLATALLAAAGCSARGGARTRPGPFGDGVPMTDPNASVAPPTPMPAGPGVVSLTDADLAPVDAYVARRRWLLGDEVEVIASREYFVQALMVASSVGRVRREESGDANGSTVVLTFVGDPAEVDVTTAPRVMIGTGLNVSARRRIVVRFTKTTDPSIPIRLQVTARGKASMGAGETVERRAEEIVVGGTLRRNPVAGWRFDEIRR